MQKPYNKIGNQSGKNIGNKSGLIVMPNHVLKKVIAISDSQLVVPSGFRAAPTTFPLNKFAATVGALVLHAAGAESNNSSVPGKPVGEKANQTTSGIPTDDGPDGVAIGFGVFAAVMVVAFIWAAIATYCERKNATPEQLAKLQEEDRKREAYLKKLHDEDPFWWQRY